MKQRTAAEQQIELLKQMKDAKAKRKPLPPPVAGPPAAERPSQGPLPLGAQPSAPFELAEGARAPRAKAKGPALPLGKETWRLLRERQASTHEFRSRREMGDWAAALLLALPPGAHRLGEPARAELLTRLREWAEARGLRP
ncbi:MAG TPA: hypothetical protein VNZ67_04530 [bacterium]|jgi:hypothetical protein|nr:hypothetical protein [bacterium]